MAAAPGEAARRTRKNVRKSEKKLSNSKFVENAPGEVVAEERRQLERAESLIEGVEESLAQLE